MLLLCHNYYRMNQIDQESNTIINSRDISVDAASLVMSIRMGGKKMNDLQVRSFLGTENDFKRSNRPLLLGRL